MGQAFFDKCSGAGIALGTYAADFQAYPLYSTRKPSSTNASASQPCAWFQLLQPYTRSNWTNSPPGNQPPGIHVCPDYVRLGGLFQVYPSQDGSYGYNAEGYSFGFDGLALGWEATNPGRTVHDTGVVCPSDMIAIADALLLDSSNTNSTACGTDLLCPAFDPVFPSLDLGYPTGSAVSPGYIYWPPKRHGGRWNVVFCDGHVENQTTKGLLDPRSEAVLRRWYRDHVAHVDGWTTLTR